MVVWTEFGVGSWRVFGLSESGVYRLFGVLETGWRGAVGGGRDDQTHRPVTPAHTTVQQNRADREMVRFLQPSVKGTVHPKIKILSSFTHPQVDPNLYECVCSEHKGRYSEECGTQSSSGS